MLYASIESIKGALFIWVCVDLFGCMRKPSLLKCLNLENKIATFFFSFKETYLIILVQSQAKK